MLILALVGSRYQSLRRCDFFLLFPSFTRDDFIDTISPCIKLFEYGLVVLTIDAKLVNVGCYPFAKPLQVRLDGRENLLMEREYVGIIAYITRRKHGFIQIIIKGFELICAMTYLLIH